MTLPPIDAGRARDLVGRFTGLSVLVVGDVMLEPLHRWTRDADFTGSAGANRPVRVGARSPGRRRERRAQHRRPRWARVARGLTGSDASAGTLRALLRTAGVDADGLVEDPARPTTEKVRVVTERNQQVARIDYERDADADGDIEGAIVAQVARLAGDAGALLVSDYLKGTITRAVVEALLRGQDRPEPRRGRRFGRADPADRRSEDPAPGVLRRRDAHHAEPPRGRNRHPSPGALGRGSATRGARLQDAMPNARRC